jgi:hypothetical protein
MTQIRARARKHFGERCPILGGDLPDAIDRAPARREAVVQNVSALTKAYRIIDQNNASVAARATSRNITPNPTRDARATPRGIKKNGAIAS